MNGLTYSDNGLMNRALLLYNDFKNDTAEWFTKKADTSNILKEKTSFRGSFSKYANPDLVSKEKHAWALAMVEKYENS